MRLRAASGGGRCRATTCLLVYLLCAAPAARALLFLHRFVANAGASDNDDVNGNAGRIISTPLRHDGDVVFENIPRTNADRIANDPTAELLSGDKISVPVELPRDFPHFLQGLMWRRELTPEGSGMLFSWAADCGAEQLKRRGFWMKDTLIDLDLIWCSADGVVVDVQTAKADDLHSVKPSLPAQFVVEMASGWAAAHGVRGGGKTTCKVEAPSDEDAGVSYFVARDVPAFGATKEAVAKARAEGLLE